MSVGGKYSKLMRCRRNTLHTSAYVLVNVTSDTCACINALKSWLEHMCTLVYIHIYVHIYVCIGMSIISLDKC